jgi:CBS domain-containing protein
MLEAWHVRDLMQRDWDHVVSPSTTLGEIIGGAGTGSRPVFAVVDDGALAGIISVPDISRVMDEPMIGDIVIAADIMVTRLTTIHPDEDLYRILETFRSTNHEALPVVSEGPQPRFLGMLSRQAIHRAVRSESERMRAYLHAEHAGIAAIEQDEQLYQLVLGVSAPKPDTIQRMPVPHDTVGKSLRAADFRRRHGAQVVGIQNEDGTLQCPPDIDAPLQREQLLLVILSQPSPAVSEPRS